MEQGDSPIVSFSGSDVVMLVVSGKGSINIASRDFQIGQQWRTDFFQMLVDKKMGSRVVAQFIGEVPQSKAAMHRHLYEESIVVLKGQGFMWTEDMKAAVKPGDVIFLPSKQIHSLECSSPDLMMLAGVIYPGDNPAINY